MFPRVGLVCGDPRPLPRPKQSDKEPVEIATDSALTVIEKS